MMAGELFSSVRFKVPAYQREYSWKETQLRDFWNDLKRNLDKESYFLGLIILSDESKNSNGENQISKRKNVVDGQQRIISISLLAAALYHQAIIHKRTSLADTLRSTFLEAINYYDDHTDPRVVLTDELDNTLYRRIVLENQLPDQIEDQDSFSQLIKESYEYFSAKLAEDLKADPFKRLGKWTELLKEKLSFAVFSVPNGISAYQIFEVVNTRGSVLTTADLLKNYLISVTSENKNVFYKRWKRLADNFDRSGNTFVQYIRHVVTSEYGYILPKELYKFIAGREEIDSDQKNERKRIPPSPEKLMELLETNLDLYLQMMDPSSSGPASVEALNTFSALNHLGVIAVRPILLSLAKLETSNAGMDFILRLVVQRVVVGSLGTGNVERMFGEGAKKIASEKKWEFLRKDFKSLTYDKSEFIEQLQKRAYRKSLLAFIRSSAIEKTTTPEVHGALHWIWPKKEEGWDELKIDDDLQYYSTIGNSVMSNLKRRPQSASIGWENCKSTLLSELVDNEYSKELLTYKSWNRANILSMGMQVANDAATVWYKT